MGIGQIFVRHYRYKQVDFLPYMYLHQLIITTGQPREIVSYDTIVYPFDIYVWGFAGGLIIVEFILLLVMQNLWSIIVSKQNPRDYFYQGFINKEYTSEPTNYKQFHYRFCPILKNYTQDELD